MTTKIYIRLVILGAFAALCNLMPTHAADISQPSAKVKAVCVIYGTHVSAPYEGKVETIVGKAGIGRRIGILMMTGAGVSASLSTMMSEIGKDFERFGASQLRAPNSVFLATIEDRDGMSGLSMGYGHGDVGDDVSDAKLDVPMACDLTALPN